VCLFELFIVRVISKIHSSVISGSSHRTKSWQYFLFQPSVAEDGVYVCRPMNSFMIFSQEQRSVVRQQHPNLDNRAVSKLLGDKWTKLSENEKRVYYDRANQVLVSYSLV